MAEVSVPVEEIQDPALAPAEETSSETTEDFGGFGSLEELKAAYAATQAPKEETQEEPEGEPEAKPEEKPEETQEEAAKEAVESAGLDMKSLGDKIAANGDIDAEDYEKLAKVGITKEIVEGYIAGQKAVGEAFIGRLHDHVGGSERFSTMLEWAKDNLSADEIASFNRTVDTGSEADLKLALSGLDARFSRTARPALLNVTAKNGGTDGVFNSVAEVTKAMNDPRYATDDAYRAKVAQKLERSNVL